MSGGTVKIEREWSSGGGRVFAPCRAADGCRAPGVKGRAARP